MTRQVEQMGISSEKFGKLPDGRDVRQFSLKNDILKVKIINYGGIVTSVRTLDREGREKDIVLGFDDLAGYLNNKPYFGAIIGRFANRIEGASFDIDGVRYELNKNDGPNQLHGGLCGFDKVLWDAQIIGSGRNEALCLSYISPDGEENYPGNLKVNVTYALTGENTLTIDYDAVSDRDTYVNLTNHSYFNLSGHDAGNIGGHWLKLKAARYTPVRKDGIPTGEIVPVQGTPMDFTAGAIIGSGLASSYEQIRLVGGYDHNFILDYERALDEAVAEVFDPASGRLLEVLTTKPAVQFYSGNFLDGSLVGKDGCAYRFRGGLCLETQYIPNAMNSFAFPSPLLKTGQHYCHQTSYRFSVKP
jgi:aldose 1-epimerase